MTIKKIELSEEELLKVQAALEKEGDDKTADTDDEEKDDEDEDDTGEKKDKKPFDELCKDKVKDKYIKKENLSEIKTIIPEGVSEEFVESFDTIVVSLVNEQISKISESLIADFMEEMDNRVDELLVAQKTELDKFISVELDKFKESQKENIVSNLKLEKAGKFLNTLKDLFTENHYILDDEKLKQVEESETKIADLEKEVNSHYETITSLKKTLNEKEIQIQLEALFAGLTELDKEKVKKLLESHDSSDSANYLKEAQKLKDYVIKAVKSSTKDNTIIEENTDEEKSELSDIVKKYTKIKG